jgi:hypothetical protein
MELLPEDVKDNIYRAKHEIEYSAVTAELEECFLQARMNNLVGILQPIAPRNGTVKLNLNIHSVKCSSAQILRAVGNNKFPFKDKLPIVYNKRRRFQQNLSKLNLRHVSTGFPRHT